MATITVKRELDFSDLQKECWSGAIDTLKTIEEHDKEDAFMSFLAYDMGYADSETLPTLTEINDLLWFDDDFIFGALGIKDEDEEEDDEDEDDEDAIPFC